MILEIYNEDCLVGMDRIKEDSVDLILCDLPYGTTNCPWDTVIPFEPLWAQYRRILKVRGAVLLFATQPFATDLINSARKMFRYDLVWEKTAPVGFANAKRMPLRSHELILVFYRKLPIYNPQGLVKLEKPIVTHRSKGDGVYKSMSGICVQEYTNYPRSVFHFPNRKGPRYHPTQKPVELIEHLVRTYSNSGDLVLDNCMGSGTTALACLNSGRRFVGFETDTNYFKAAQKRIDEWNAWRLDNVQSD